MKTFIYTYERAESDHNGNARHWTTVYRLKKNDPILVVDRAEVGFRTPTQAVIEELREAGQLPRNSPRYAGALEAEGVARIVRV